MTMLSASALAGRTGRGVRVAVVDTGVHAEHPHVGGINGGIAIDAGGGIGDDLIDRLGHGTAVAAAIREKARDAELLAVKVFDRRLVTTGAALVAGVNWAAGQGVHLINLSLGTTNPDHRDALATAVAQADALGAVVVAAAPQPGAHWLPGALPGVVAVDVDWACPRETCHVVLEADGGLRLRASGYPRPIPGVPADQNVSGISFAVANATGVLALLLEGARERGLAGLCRLLRAP